LAEATSSSRGLRWLTKKSPGYSAEPQSRGRRPGVAVWGRKAPEASKQRTRVGITRLASRLREVRSLGIRPMMLQRQIPKVPLVGVYPSLGFRACLGISGMNGNEGYWGGEISIISQNISQNPLQSSSIHLIPPFRSSISP
jgi:hypothetical protein